MKPIIPYPLPDGSIAIAKLPAGAKIKEWRGMIVCVHPDHQPLIIHPDGTTETLKAPDDVSSVRRDCE